MGSLPPANISVNTRRLIYDLSSVHLAGITIIHYPFTLHPFEEKFPDNMADKLTAAYYRLSHLKLEFHRGNRTHRAASGRNTSLLHRKHIVNIRFFRPDAARCVRFSRCNSSLRRTERYQERSLWRKHTRAGDLSLLWE